MMSSPSFSSEGVTAPVAQAAEAAVQRVSVPAGGVAVVLPTNDQGLAAGQYAVFYQGGMCLGAAKIM